MQTKNPRFNFKPRQPVGNTFAGTGNYHYFEPTAEKYDMLDMAKQKRLQSIGIMDVSTLPKARETGWTTGTITLAVLDKLRTDIQANPAILGASEADRRKELERWGSYLFALFVEFGTGAGNKCQNWFYARQLYTAISTASLMFTREQSWHWWGKLDEGKKMQRLDKWKGSADQVFRVITDKLVEWSQLASLPQLPAKAITGTGQAIHCGGSAPTAVNNFFNQGWKQAKAPTKDFHYTHEDDFMDFVEWSRDWEVSELWYDGSKVLDIKKHMGNSKSEITRSSLIVGIHDVIRPKFQRNKSLIEYKSYNGSDVDADRATRIWQSNLYNLFIECQHCTGQKNRSWYYARQLYTLVGTAVGVDREECWKRWDIIDDFAKRGSHNFVAHLNKHATCQAIINQMTAWMENISNA